MDLLFAAPITMNKRLGQGFAKKWFNVIVFASSLMKTICANRKKAVAMKEQKGARRRPQKTADWTTRHRSGRPEAFF
jgi:hypothetical protein